MHLENCRDEREKRVDDVKSSASHHNGLGYTVLPMAVTVRRKVMTNPQSRPSSGLYSATQCMKLGSLVIVDQHATVGHSGLFADLSLGVDYRMR